MKFERLDRTPEPNMAIVVPSHKGARFIVKTARGSDFVGDEVRVWGITADDVAAIVAGDISVMRTYLEPDDSEPGIIHATDKVTEIDVTETTTHTFVTGVRHLHEVGPIAGPHFLPPHD